MKCLQHLKIYLRNNALAFANSSPLRMTTLYQIAQTTGGIVVGTVTKEDLCWICNPRRWWS